MKDMAAPLPKASRSDTNSDNYRLSLVNCLAALAPQGICVAFSGGVDSAVVLAAAAEAATRTGGAPSRIHAVTLHSPLHSPAEPERAARAAAELGATHAVVALDGIPDSIVDNPPERCYLCKRELFARLRAYADRHRLTALLDGTNADDLTVHRPGRRALAELAVRSPLAELGYGKADVRALARRMGLAAADSPAAPCLATRFPYGVRLTAQGMAAAARIEEAVKAAGIGILRARIHGDTVRLEVEPSDFSRILAARADLAALCHELGYRYITLDIEGFRSGSMDTAVI